MQMYLTIAAIVNDAGSKEYRVVIKTAEYEIPVHLYSFDRTLDLIRLLRQSNMTIITTTPKLAQAINEFL